MLLTIIEIVAFMAAAAIVGAALGWVLRGALGSEQAEISDLRAQLRQLKKASREGQVKNQATTRAEKASVATTSTTAGTVKSTAGASTEKSVKKNPAKVARKTSKRKTQAERDADQASGAKAFSEVIARVGNSEADDNLTKIYGVGKKYASMLNDLGVSSYEQISKLRKADVRTLAAALGVLDDRLETENWVGSAKTLIKEAKK